MHELSIAASLVELVEEQASKVLRLPDAARISVVGIRLGALSGVVKESLLFCFDSVTRGTRMQDAVLEIEEISVTIFCTTCDTEQTLPSIQSLRCPVCGTVSLGITRGKELELSFIELSEDTTNEHAPTPYQHENCPA